MNCPKCNVRMDGIKATRVFGGNIVVENISALSCPKCRETLFDEKAYSETLQKIQEVRKEIPVSLLAKIKAMFL